MNHDLLMKITENMPMKCIPVRGEGYLERYFVSIDEHGNQDWLHRFLRNDSEEHLHSHPWEAVSTILFGHYMEYVLAGLDVTSEVHLCGSVINISPHHIHRISAVEPNTWTHMHVKAGRAKEWFFIDSDGNKKYMPTSPADWYLNCKPREK